jgi:hypothetical protein
MKEVSEKRIIVEEDEIKDAITAFVLKRKPEIRSNIKDDLTVRFYTVDGMLVRPRAELVVESSSTEVTKRS